MVVYAGTLALSLLGPADSMSTHRNGLNVT